MTDKVEPLTADEVGWPIEKMTEAEWRERIEGHTPAPWRAGSLESYDMSGRPFRCVYRGDGESVETRTYIRGGEGEDGKVFDADADAFLVAAGPALLAEVDSLRSLLSTSEARCRALEEGLRYIADPISAMQAAAREDACNLDGHMAIRIADDPHHLRGMAQRVLAAAALTPEEPL